MGHIDTAWLYFQFWRYLLTLYLTLSKNLANSEHLPNCSCIFVSYAPNVEVDIDASKLYGNCPDPFRMDTYENGDEHEIMLSLIQLSGSTSLPPKVPVKGTKSNASEENKDETGGTSQQSSCKKPFTDPSTLAKYEYTKASSILHIFHSHNYSVKSNKLSSASNRLKLKQRRENAVAVTDVVIEGVCVRTILASKIKRI